MVQNEAAIQAILQNLQDAGCDSEEIEPFLTAYQNKDCPKLLRLLEQHRACLLEDVHQGERKISCLDYLAYQIRQGTCFKK